MTRVGCISFAAFAIVLSGCSRNDEIELDSVESAGKKPPPKDAAVAADARPPDARPPDAAIDAAIDAGGGGGAPGFIDACTAAGMTPASFTPTASFDATDEGVTAPITLPFSFTFYGVMQSNVWITTNGQLGFGTTPRGSAFGQVTCPLPDSRFASTPIVLVYSVDLVGQLDTSSAGGVCYATVGTAPNRKFVVTWKNSFFYELFNASQVTFSAVLNEGTNVIDVAIDNVDARGDTFWESGAGSVVGTQVGAASSTFSCQAPNAPEGTVAHFNP